MQYYSEDVEHIAGHLKWKLTRHDVPFTPVEEAGMVDLENTMAVGVPYFQTQKTMTLAVQQNYFCKMIEPLFTTVLHVGFKRNMGATMFPFFLTVSPREAVIPSLLCMFTAGALGAGLKQIWRAPRPFYIRPDLLIGAWAEGFSSPSLHSTMAAASGVFWMMRFFTTLDIVLCVLLVSSVMLSRVYLGVHYVTDTIGGAIIGGVCGFLFGSDTICLWLSKCFFDDSIHPLFPAAVMIALVNVGGALQYAMYWRFGPIDPDLFAFYNLNVNPGNVRKAWWSAATASGQLLGAGLVLDDARWRTKDYVTGSQNMTMLQLVALAICYCFSLFHIIEQLYRKYTGPV